MDCLFCKIISGEIPSKKIYEDASSVGFLDINPANPGHTLVVPKRHSENIFDADDESLKGAIVAVKKVTSMIKERTGCQGVNIVQNNGKAAGQIVSHVHFHVIPRNQGDSVVISYPRKQTDEKELDDMASKLTRKKSAALDEEIMREMGRL
ncbi:MAG: HIT family protein [Candidatus Aenigmarchaeota archaeon]|nr:HIT family protein [Candidatus Aenigmarchaeota archaeon]